MEGIISGAQDALAVLSFLAVMFGILFVLGCTLGFVTGLFEFLSERRKKKADNAKPRTDT